MTNGFVANYLLLLAQMIHWNFFSCFVMNSGIAENEKREIRRLILVDAFREPIPQVAVQMAVLVGCISRYDYPDDWVEVRI